MVDTGAISPQTMADDSSTGDVAWSNPDNAKVSDNVYATCYDGSGDASTGHYLKATNFGFSIPSGATINGILVEIEKKRTGGTYGAVKDNIVKLVKADGTLGATDKADTATTWPTTDTYTPYGSSSDLWVDSWDDTKINDIDFGVVLSAKSASSLDGWRASVDHIRITVYYTNSTITGVQTMTGVSTITF